MELKRKEIPKQGLLHRPRINGLLAQGLEYSLVTVVAATGYGKTQAVADFARRLERSYWLHLSSLDNITYRFWQNFIWTIRHDMPRLANQFGALGFPDTLTKFDAFLRLFAAEIYGGPQVVLIADDYSNIHSPEIRRFFEQLVEASLENFCLIMLSSNRTNLDLACLKGSGSLYQITDAELKLTPEEIRQLFALYQLELPERILDQLLTETGGWILPLQLIGQHYQGSAWQSLEITNQSSVALPSQLFEQECFSGFSDEMQHLLVQLALLPNFSSEIIRNLGGVDLQAASELLNTHMFISFDVQTQLYTLHPLYRRFLEQKKYLLSPEEQQHVYTVAGDWFFAYKRTLEAIECLGQCGNYEKMVRAIERYPNARLSVSLANYLLEHLRLPPQEFVREHRIVDYLIATIYLNNLDIAAAERQLLRLEQELQDSQRPEDQAVLGEVYITLGAIGMMRQRASFPAYYAKASALLPRGSRIQKPNQMLVGNSKVIFLASEEPGELERMCERYAQATPHIEHLYHGAGRGLDSLFFAEAAYHTYDFQAVKEHAFRAIYQGKEANQQDIVCNGYLNLAKVALIRGDYEESIQLIDTITDYINSNSLLSLYELRDSIISWFYMLLNDYDKVVQWQVLDNFEEYEQAPMDIGQDKIIYATFLLHKHQYERVLAYLDKIAPICENKGMWLDRLQIEIMRAVCYLKTGRDQQALECFWRAYRKAYHNGLVTPFVEFGNYLRPVVDLARRAERYDFDQEWLDSIYTKASSYAKRIAMMSKTHARKQRPQQAENKNSLSRRELEILQSMAQGLTQDEIADFHKVSVNTVKTHIKNIYNKLGAVNRSDAMHIATVSKLIQ